MKFIDHSDLADKHAFLSPSNSSWLRYTVDKMIARYDVWQNAARGTKLHALAKMAIDLKVKFADTPQTINMYVNDRTNVILLIQLFRHSRHYIF